MTEQLPTYFTGRYHSVRVIGIPYATKDANPSHYLIAHYRWIKEAEATEESEKIKAFLAEMKDSATPFAILVPNSTEVVLEQTEDRHPLRPLPRDFNTHPRTRHFSIDGVWSLFPFMADDGTVYHATGEISTLEDFNRQREFTIADVFRPG